MAAAPRYIASTWNAWEALFPTVLLLLHDVSIGADCTEDTVSNVTLLLRVFKTVA
jgi:hypothetical protein